MNDNTQELCTALVKLNLCGKHVPQTYERKHVLNMILDTKYDSPGAGMSILSMELNLFDNTELDCSGILHVSLNVDSH